MKRNVDMNEISDGKLYSANDMARCDCNGCKNCSECCKTTADTIILDPWDMKELKLATGKGFKELLKEGIIEINLVDGIALPNLCIKENGCTFLNQEGRCSVHDHRPGFCRLFPLGRIYREDGFDYFIQIHECKEQHRSKIKIHKWIGIPNIKEYETYVWEWHQYLLKLQEQAEELQKENTEESMIKARELSMSVLAKYDV